MNGTVYTQIPGEEHFYTTDETQTVTVNRLIADAYPTLYKSMRKKLIVPPELSLLGYSSRYKIIRAAQFHYAAPPIDDAAKELTVLFHHFEEETTERQYSLQQFNAIRWAVGYENENLPSAMMLRWGFISPKTTGDRMVLPSIHKITQTSAGIMVDFEITHTLQERLTYACMMILQQHQDNLRLLRPCIPGDYFKIGCANFYKYKGRFVSLEPERNQAVKAKIQNYVDNVINALKENADGFDVPIPTIEDPDEWVERDPLFLTWDDFVFEEGATEAQYAQRRSNNNQACLNTLLAAAEGHDLSPNIPYKTAELRKIFSDKNLKTAKKLGFIKPAGKYAYYYLSFLADLEGGS